MLDRPELRQLRQRIVLRHNLKPLRREGAFDTYIDERLRLAGYTGKGIFKRSARRRIYPGDRRECRGWSTSCATAPCLRATRRGPGDAGRRRDHRGRGRDCT